MYFERPEINRAEIFRKVNAPEDLASFMKAYIKYGFVGKKDGKIYSPEFEGWGQGEQPEQGLQDPENLLVSGYGTCWEQTELEKQWFVEHNIEFKTFLFMFGPDISQKHPAHTFLAFRKDDKWYWLENTLDGHNGIQEFGSLEELTEVVKKVVTDNAVRNGATEEDVSQGRLLEYDISVHGVSPQEFVGRIMAVGEGK